MQNNYSASWKKRGDRTGLIRNALLKSMGYTDSDIEKPIVGIINTWAETNPGHVHFRQLADAVKRGVWAAGGFPLELNTMSICEVFFDISSLIYRNLLSVTTEELIERHPFDGVVLIGGCFGTQVLHVAPESAVGGPLAAVRDGDIIHLDVDNNLIELELSDEEIENRLKDFKPKVHDDIKRGFVRNFIDSVTQADEGCDLTYMQYKD